MGYWNPAWFPDLSLCLTFVKQIYVLVPCPYLGLSQIFVQNKLIRVEEKAARSQVPLIWGLRELVSEASVQHNPLAPSPAKIKPSDVHFKNSPIQTGSKPAQNLKWGKKR